MTDIETAIRIVARQVLANAADEIQWEVYADIGEYDWETVQVVVAALVDPPTIDEWTTAYDLLAARANHDGDT